MSKQHAIIPQWFTESQATNPAILKKAYYVRKEELRKLIERKVVKPFGETGKMWQWSHPSLTHSNQRVECGRISLEIPSKLRDLMASEMALRPSWSLQEA